MSVITATPDPLPPLDSLRVQVEPCLSEVEEMLSSAGPNWPRWILQAMEHDISEGYSLIGEILSHQMDQTKAAQGTEVGQVCPLPPQLSDLRFFREADLCGRLVVFLASARRNVITARRLSSRWELLPSLVIWSVLCVALLGFIAASALNGAPLE